MSTLTLSVSAFDTLRYVKKLKAANVPEPQAEAQAEALHEVLDAVLADQAAKLATRADLRSELALVRKEIIIARRDTIIWLGGILGGLLIAGFGVMLTVFYNLLG